MKYVWLINAPNPHTTHSEIPASSGDRSSVPDDLLWQEWLSGKAIGEPKPTDNLSAEQLKAQGYVGVYKYI